LPAYGGGHEDGIEVVKSVKQKHFSTTKLTKEHERKLLPNAVDFIFLRKNHTPHEGVQTAGACRFPAIYQLLLLRNETTLHRFACILA
jgi:hypothetical protein